MSSAMGSWTCAYVGLITPFCGKITYISWISSSKSLRYKLLNKQFWKWGTCAQWLHSVQLNLLNNSIDLLMIYWFFQKGILLNFHRHMRPREIYIPVLIFCLFVYLVKQGKGLFGFKNTFIIHFLIDYSDNRTLIYFIFVHWNQYYLICKAFLFAQIFLPLFLKMIFHSLLYLS